LIGSRLYGFVCRFLRDACLAEDVYQEILVKLAKNASGFDRRAKFNTWLYRIAHNQVANWHRDRGRQRVVPLDDFTANSVAADAPEAVTESSDEEARLLQSIRDLPPDRQQLLVLKFVERLSNAEIGTIMNRTEGAVKSLYHRTLLALRGSLEEQEGPERGAQRGRLGL